MEIMSAWQRLMTALVEIIECILLSLPYWFLAGNKGNTFQDVGLRASREKRNIFYGDYIPLLPTKNQ